MKVKKIDARKANSSEAARKEYISHIATMTRGLDGSKDPDKLYDRLMGEAHGNTPGRPMEFIPVKFILNRDDKRNAWLIIDEDGNEEQVSEDIVDGIRKFSTLQKTELYSDNYKVWHVYSNIRTLMKSGLEYPKIPYNTSNDEYFALDMKIPMFVWAQLYTHTQLSKISESDRVSVNTTEEMFDFWVPDDFVEKFNIRSKEEFESDPVNQLGLYTELNEKEVKEKLFNNYSQKDVRVIFKELGYGKQIYSRAIYYMQYKRSIFGGWKTDSNGWVNLLNERLNGWTQETTKEVATLIYQLYIK